MPALCSLEPYYSASSVSSHLFTLFPSLPLCVFLCPLVSLPSWDLLWIAVLSALQLWLSLSSWAISLTVLSPSICIAVPEFIPLLPAFSPHPTALQAPLLSPGISLLLDIFAKMKKFKRKYNFFLQWWKRSEQLQTYDLTFWKMQLKEEKACGKLAKFTFLQVLFLPAHSGVIHCRWRPQLYL